MEGAAHGLKGNSVTVYVALHAREQAGGATGLHDSPRERSSPLDTHLGPLLRLIPARGLGGSVCQERLDLFPVLVQLLCELQGPFPPRLSLPLWRQHRRGTCRRAASSMLARVYAGRSGRTRTTREGGSQESGATKSHRTELVLPSAARLRALSSLQPVNDSGTCQHTKPTEDTPTLPKHNRP